MFHIAFYAKLSHFSTHSILCRIISFLNSRLILYIFCHRQQLYFLKFNIFIFDYQTNKINKIKDKKIIRRKTSISNIFIIGNEKIDR